MNIATTYIKQAFSNIKQHMLRSFLTLLGVLVGTGAIVALLTGSELATQSALSQFKKLGTDLIAVNMNEPSPSAHHLIDQAKLTQIQQFYSDKILKVLPYTLHYSEALYETRQLGASIMGITEELEQLMHLKISTGRFISDLDKTSFYCVLGNDVAKELSEDPSDLIGKQLNIEKSYFTIIGILDPSDKNLFLLTDLNQAIIVPINSALALYKNAQISNVIFKLRSESDIASAKETIQSYLELIHPGLQLNFRSPESIIENMQKQNHIFKLLLGFIGGISLLVGGIGVMNIMLVSVTERRREIGIRMAVGAQKKDILYLFLAEAAILTLLGGLAGIVIGELIGYITAKVSHWEYTFFLSPILIGFLVSVLVGLFFGYYPAKKASQSDPIDILRSS